ncbi:ABC transporter ATP-binding protein [Streptococcus ratti]|uniref:ABC transporter ATP-binding protein n=1 Tax=Streptococcus ratti TaxID=1341 RepID=A0A7X9LEN2_STRRT|nr:ABC transporter ATP-binding protein [Streptococcus ratti]NMD49499.1 ABC transporter ATP-binding protein [Streptococcus ratti]
MGQVFKIMLQKNKVNFILSILFCSITAIFNIASAFILKDFIDIALAGNIKRLNNLLLLAVAYIILFLFISYAATFFKNLYISKGDYNLKSKLLNTILYKAINFFNSENTNRYIKLFSVDLEAVKVNVIENKIDFFKNVITLILGLLSMIFLNIYLFLGILVTTIVSVLIGTLFNKILPNIETHTIKSSNSLNVFISDLLKGFQIVKIFQIEKRTNKIFLQKLDAEEKLLLRKNNIYNIVNVFSEASTNIMAFVLFYIGANQVISGNTSMGTVVAYIQLLNFVVVPIQKIPNSIMKYSSSKNIMEFILHLINEKPRREIGEASISFSEDIVLNNVSFFYKDSSLPALDNINFTFKKGKKYAIVGHSGSGKSTLLNILQKHWETYWGNIYIDGVDLRVISSNLLYRNLSVMQQEVFIFDDTIMNNITLFSDFKDEDVKSVIKNSNLDEVIANKGMDYLCGENGYNLSGGERQRIAIARSLLQKAPILLFDEATSSLDNETTANIEELILNMNEVTCLIISHKLHKNILCKFDQILVLKNGRLVESGTFDELMKNQSDFWALYKLSN